MFCPYCGNSYNDGERFCSRCGREIGTPPEGIGGMGGASFGGNGVEKVCIAAFKDPLFLIMCILTTVCVLSFNVITLLFAIFMWLVFAKARSNSCDVDNMRRISGTAYAMVVLNWVLVGLLCLMAVIFIALGRSDVFERLADMLEDNDYIGGIFLTILASDISYLFSIILFVAAGILALLNCLVYIPVHRMAKAMYTGVQSGVLPCDLIRRGATVMLVIGILNGISAVMTYVNVRSMLLSGCGAVVWILGYVLVKKYFLSREN